MNETMVFDGGGWAAMRDDERQEMDSLRARLSEAERLLADPDERALAAGMELDQTGS